MAPRKVPKKYLVVLKVFPKNVPKRLIREYKKIVKQYKKEGGYQRKLARHLNVNIKYVNDLLVDGIEPTSRTEKGQIARRKLFLPTKKSKEELEAIRIHRRQVQEELNKDIEARLKLVMERMDENEHRERSKKISALLRSGGEG